MNSFEVGDFIKIRQSKKPALVINVSNGHLLVSIHEYNGDYLWIDANNTNNTNNIEILELSPEEKLSILAGFGKWYYEQHTLLYQEFIIEALG
jgi:hypothetical protein